MSAQAYAVLHRKYLESRHPQMYGELKASGKLIEYVQKRGQDAEEYDQNLQAQMLADGEIEANAVAHLAQELTLNDLIYSL
jgi:hypothetical protein